MNRQGPLKQAMGSNPQLRAMKIIPRQTIEMERIIRVVFLLIISTMAALADTRPNILWITSEDNGPHLGCYGDKYAQILNLDRLAAKGLIYLNAWSCGPVCAAARTAIISGLYPPATGSEHMRSLTRLPASMKMYPQFLREAGYYCSNNEKEDYNLQKPGKVWDDSSKKAHWKNRPPGQPFFSIFNILVSHESQIRIRPHKLVHDPAQARLPAYHPDTPEVRRDWAQYYDKVTEMDAIAGKHLKELEEAGLAEDTIIFYYGDHGSGMPRSKRWPYDSGLHVPLIVYIPEKFKSLAPKEYRAGGTTDRLVSFIDLEPTLLSLAGIPKPEYLHGHAFLGKAEEPVQPYLYGFRGRMDERYDLVRSVRDKRYVYLRNYMPHLIYGQHVDYMFHTPTTRVWKQLYDQRKLTPPKTLFWERKPPQELYDLQEDPDEVKNLAHSVEHQQILKTLRQAQQQLALRIRDIGFLPEGEIHSRSSGSSPYEIGHDDAKYPLTKIMAMAETASMQKPEAISELKHGLSDGDSAVRYWAAMGILMFNQVGPVEMAKGELRQALNDSSPYVRIVAAQALGQFGNDAELRSALKVLTALAPIDQNGIYTSMAALNALDALGRKAISVKEVIAALPTTGRSVNARMDTYAPRLVEHILENFTDHRPTE